MWWEFGFELPAGGVDFKTVSVNFEYLQVRAQVCYFYK